MGGIFLSAEDTYNKPTFDGRLKYYDHLKSYWDLLAKASLNNDYNSWRKILRGYYARTHAFIKKSEIPIILEKFRKIDIDLTIIPTCTVQGNKQFYENHVLKLLQEIEDSLFMATKDMLVTTKSDGDENFDMDKFLGESG